LAFVVASIITVPIYLRLRRNSARPKLTQVVATSREVPVGVALGPEDVKLVDWPADAPLVGSFSKVENVVGRPLIYPLGTGEPVLERDLAVSGSGIGLSVKIPPGMRATAVRCNEIVGVAGFLFPGSHVDVLATFTPPGSNGAETQTVLQDVEVLTSGQTIQPDPQGKPQTVNVVTLLLSPEDAQKLLLTSGQGNIQFVLRSGVDQKKVDLGPTRVDQLGQSSATTSTKAPVVFPTKVVKKERPPRPQIAPPPPPYLVEVIKGNERTVQKF
jgi:pilus assembly protein CpaB